LFVFHSCLFLLFMSVYHVYVCFYVYLFLLKIGGAAISNDQQMNNLNSIFYEHLMMVKKQTNMKENMNELKQTSINEKKMNMNEN